MGGYIYVLSNRHMPGLVKIGRSDRHPVERVVELSRPTGVPAQFTLEGCVQVDDARVAEAKLHAIFADARAPRREFFAVSVLAALEAASLLGVLEEHKFAISKPPQEQLPMWWLIYMSSFITLANASILFSALKLDNYWAEWVWVISVGFVGVGAFYLTRRDRHYSR